MRKAVSSQISGNDPQAYGSVRMPANPCESTNHFFIVNNTKTSRNPGFCEAFCFLENERRKP